MAAALDAAHDDGEKSGFLAAQLLIESGAPLTGFHLSGVDTGALYQAAVDAYAGFEHPVIVMVNEVVVASNGFELLKAFLERVKPNPDVANSSGKDGSGHDEHMPEDTPLNP